MMKKIIYCLLAAAVFSSCSNKDKEAGAAMPEQEKDMRELIAKYPDSVLLKENLVQYFRNSANYGQAIAEVDKELKKDSLNDHYWDMKAILHYENDDTAQAISSWEKALRINANPQYMMALGTAYALTKNPLAIAMSQLLGAGPQTKYQGIFIRGMYLNNIGDYENASALFDACMQMDYTNLLAYREKAICQYNLQKYEDALNTLELAARVKKDYDEIWYWMGRCYEKLDRKDDAIQAYQLALQITPDYIEAKDALGKLGVR